MLSSTPPPPPPPPPRRGRWFGLAFVAALAAGVWAVASGTLEIPQRFDPWAPLDVSAPPDWLTRFKLSRARGEPRRCLAALAQTGMQYDLLPDRVTGPGCGFDNAVRLRAAGVRLGTAPSLSCPMALSFFMWERYALQPAARQHYGQKVVAIDHLGSYACRNVNRGEGEVPGSASLTSVSASRSRHATANALDVAGLTLADGRRITVLKGWSRDDGTGAKGTGGADTAAAAAAATPADDPAALLLRDAHRGACRFFDGVLGPDYNAVHRDHFHLETGGYTMCR